MLKVGVIGVNHKLADLVLREELAKTCLRHLGISTPFVFNDQFVVLSTCNRTEIYFSADDLAETHTHLLSLLRRDTEEDFEQKLYSFFGVDCFVHLLRVTAGLDSAILGETEIQGQVKKAYESSIGHKRLPKELHFLFQKSLAISKKIRSEHYFGRGFPSLEQAIFQTGQHFFKSLPQPRILFIGASAINSKIWEHFKAKQLDDLTVCNRSPKNNLSGIKTLDWNAKNTWASYDWIIVGTRAPYYLIDAFDRPVCHPQLIMDLSVPRNVDPELGKKEKLTLLNIDQINRLLEFKQRGLQRSIADIESLIHHAASHQVRQFTKREHHKILVS